MEGKTPKIIVIGTSAGGMQALTKLLSKLPDDLPAALFVVQHLSVDSSVSFLVDRLNQFTELNCKVAEHEAAIETGTVYMAPPDRHLLVKDSQMLVMRGPRENQFRPGIDPLFRSAAAYYGANAIGVILTGFMSDGVLGMESIKRSGGTTVVQDPQDAEFPTLPHNVIRQVPSDYIVPIAEMGSLLPELVQNQENTTMAIPTDIWQEAKIAERIMMNSTMTSIKELDEAGDRTPYTCPECGGGLWDFSQPGTLMRYRCHSGHSFSKDSLLLSMDSELEETLWVALRSLEERRNILLHMSQSETNNGNQRWSTMQEERAEEMKAHVQRLRELLTQSALSDQNRNMSETG